ncbi:MAG: hypothetical protein IPH04_10615 [Saprospirales bacterium]|nr:hypothetical protein [Saprospirales bacterium]
MDQTGPTVVCPTSPLTINVYSGSYNPNGGPHQICTGNVVIPPLVVTGDDCSGVNPSGYVTQLWTFGAGTLLQSIPGNGGTFPNVELIADNPPSNNAQYTVRHVFKDICGNISECIYNITVVDKGAAGTHLRRDHGVGTDQQRRLGRRLQLADGFGSGRWFV